MVKRLIMLGTSMTTRGGVASVLNQYSAHGWFQRWDAEYIATHRDGTLARKFFVALGALMRFVWMLARDARAVLHVHSASHASFWRKCVFMSVGLIAGCPVLLHLHGGGFRRFYELECGSLGRRVVRFFLDHAERVIVLSESVRTWIENLTPGARVACIPNPAPVRENKSLKNGDVPPFLLFVGRIEKEKGVFDLLEAFSAVRKWMPGLALVCAGEGDHEALDQRAGQLGVRDALRLPGWVDRDKLQPLLERAIAFVLPSYTESQPMSLLEAMVAGTPVIATSVGAIPELVTHGATGFLHTPGDTAGLERCLRKVLLDRESAGRVACAARAAVLERHAPERVLGMLADIYRDAGLAPRAAARMDLRSRSLGEAA